jgi:hypothetical protein
MVPMPFQQRLTVQTLTEQESAAGNRQLCATPSAACRRGVRGATTLESAEVFFFFTLFLQEFGNLPLIQNRIGPVNNCPPVLHSGPNQKNHDAKHVL